MLVPFDEFDRLAIIGADSESAKTGYDWSATLSVASV
jgi:hypothetical protein